MIKKILSVSLAVLMAATCAACTVTEKEEPDLAHTAYINAKGEATPLSIRVKDRDILEKAIYDEAYTGVNNDFAILMTNAMPENFTGVYSPLSLQIALQILAMGGDEKTCDLLLSEVCPGMTRKDIEISSAALIAKLTKSAGVSINSAVAVNSAYRVCEEFANSAADHYLASVGTVDFSNPDKALQEINGWVEKNTDGLVKELISRVGPDTAVVILNALTLKLNWKTQFTAMRGLIDFKDVNGNVQSAPEIKLVTDLMYGSFDEGEMAILPYEGEEYAMALILPAEGISAAKAATALMGRYDECSPHKTCVRMPKIDIDSKLDILDMVDKLNIADGINGDFSGLVNEDVTITEIVQGASLSVTESGTTAAAATAVVASKGIEFFETEMVCDRPFAMVIYNVETGAVLFVSLVNSLEGAASPASK